MTDTFTPGPWSVSGVRFKWRTSYSDQVMDSHQVGPDDGKGSVAIVPYNPRNHAEEFANARLIAAAPDMLAALQAVVRVADRATVEFDMARAAISKATAQ